MTSQTIGACVVAALTISSFLPISVAHMLYAHLGACEQKPMLPWSLGYPSKNSWGRAKYRLS